MADDTSLGAYLDKATGALLKVTEKPPEDDGSYCLASVSAINADGSLQVIPGSFTQVMPCGRACNPSVGDRVVVLIRDTHWLAIATIGGDSPKTTTVTTAGTDLDDYRDAGSYYFASSYTPAHIPFGTNGYLQVIRGNSSTNVKQIWSRHGTNDTNDHQTAIRTRMSSGWSSWHRLLTDADIAIPVNVASGGTGATQLAGPTGAIHNLFPSSTGATATYIPCFAPSWEYPGYASMSQLRTALGLTTATQNMGSISGCIQIGQLLVQWGSVDITPPANGVGSVAVTYPRSYAATPAVFVTARTSSPQNAQPSVSNTSATGATINCWRTVATLTSVSWLAVGFLTQ